MTSPTPYVALPPPDWLSSSLPPPFPSLPSSVLFSLCGFLFPSFLPVRCLCRWRECLTTAWESFCCCWRRRWEGIRCVASFNSQRSTSSGNRKHSSHAMTASYRSPPPTTHHPLPHSDHLPQSPPLLPPSTVFSGPASAQRPSPVLCCCSDVGEFVRVDVDRP